MIIKFLKAASAFVVLTICGMANAGLITTTFASNNGAGGNMFDLVIAGSDITVTGMDINIIGNRNVELYTRIGGYNGFQNDAAAWTLMRTGSVASNGSNVASLFDFTDFTLASSTTYGIYITSSGGSGFNYTNGGNTYVNSDLTLIAGIGKTYVSQTDFTGANFSPRTWNGTIRYDTITADVPEPSTLAIFALGIMGLASRRFKKQS
jgi:hypothetical protein